METEIVLDEVEQRVLGSLLEKQRTVPASYPLTLNALRSACNQTSSRDPVSDYDDQVLQDTLRGLKERGLVRIVWADRGPRTLKYHQTLDEALSLQPDERALMTVLLLRGAAGARRAAHPDRAAAPVRRPRAGRGGAAPDGLAPDAAGPRARAATRAAGPPLGAPPRPGTRRGRRSRGAGRRPRVRAGAGSGGPRRPGGRGVRRPRDDVRRPPDRRARPQALRPLAARPGGRSRRRAGRRRRHRTRPRGRAPRRGGRVRHRRRPVAGDGRRGPTPVPRPRLRGRRPDRPPAAAHRCGLGRDHRVVRARARRALGARPGGRLPGAGARARGLAGAGPAHRRRGPARRRVVGPARRRRLRPARHRPRCWPRCAAPASRTWSGTCAARCPSVEVETERLYVLARRPESR